MTPVSKGEEGRKGIVGVIASKDLLEKKCLLGKAYHH